MRAENPVALHHARNVFREQIRADPGGVYADQYRRALEYVEHRIRLMRRGRAVSEK